MGAAPNLIIKPKAIAVVAKSRELFTTVFSEYAALSKRLANSVDKVGIMAYICTTPQNNNIDPSVPKAKYFTDAVIPP